jgi:hypothetical protein
MASCAASYASPIPWECYSAISQVRLFVLSAMNTGFDTLNASMIITGISAHPHIANEHRNVYALYLYYTKLCQAFLSVGRETT